jgi:hypothetical protein
MSYTYKKTTLSSSFVYVYGFYLLMLLSNVIMFSNRLSNQECIQVNVKVIAMLYVPRNIIIISINLSKNKYNTFIILLIDFSLQSLSVLINY